LDCSLSATSVAAISRARRGFSSAASASPGVFERYADDAICHCSSAEEARELWRALADRFAACKLVLHPEKTKIVYCKDANRRGDFPVIGFDFLGFQFRARKTMWVRAKSASIRMAFYPLPVRSR
jgi:hypothetical protein